MTQFQISSVSNVHVNLLIVNLLIVNLLDAVLQPRRLVHIPVACMSV